MTIVYISSSFAKEEKLTLQATASSSYNSSYGPGKAVDGNVSTYWVGAQNKAPWRILFDAGSVNYITQVNIKWYSAVYAPRYDIQVSQDGAAWENVFTNIQGIYSQEGEAKNINKKARYIRLYIRQVSSTYPILREFEANKKLLVPHTIHFQGLLEDGEGAPIEGTHSLTFKLYNQAEGGIALWQETQDSITVEEGLLDVTLGAINSIELPFNKEYWLGIEVESDSEMIPRFKLATSPYSFTSEN